MEVGWLLVDLCVKLGYCLKPEDTARLLDSPPMDVDAFTDAVMTAEGFDPRYHKDLRREVRDLVSRHFQRLSPEAAPTSPASAGTASPRPRRRSWRQMQTRKR